MRVRLSVQAGALRCRHYIELGQQFVARALQANVGILNLKARLFHFGTSAQGFGDQVFAYAYGLLFGNVDGSGGNYTQGAKRGV